MKNLLITLILLTLITCKKDDGVEIAPEVKDMYNLLTGGETKDFQAWSINYYLDADSTKYINTDKIEYHKDLSFKYADPGAFNVEKGTYEIIKSDGIYTIKHNTGNTKSSNYEYLGEFTVEKSNSNSIKVKNTYVDPYLNSSQTEDIYLRKASAVSVSKDVDYCIVGNWVSETCNGKQIKLSIDENGKGELASPDCSDLCSGTYTVMVIKTSDGKQMVHTQQISVCDETQTPPADYDVSYNCDSGEMTVGGVKYKRVN